MPSMAMVECHSEKDRWTLTFPELPEDPVRALQCLARNLNHILQDNLSVIDSISWDRNTVDKKVLQDYP